MSSPLLVALAALVAGTAVPACAGTAVPDPLDRYRWSRRVLVVSAPGPDDPRLAGQRQALAAMRAGAGERELVLLEAVGPGEPARAIRVRLGIDPAGFATVLVGKDGGPKLRATRVLGPDDLFPVIDAMPMRQNEMRR